MNQHVTGAKAEKPMNTAQRIFDRWGVDETKTIAQFIAEARKNASFAAELMQRGARELFNQMIRSHNSTIYSGRPLAPIVAASPEALRKAQVRAAGASARQVRMLLDTYLPNRVRMRDAKRADIQDAIDVYEPQARDMAQKVEYFRKVLAGLEGEQTVGDVFDDRALTRILESART